MASPLNTTAANSTVNSFPSNTMGSAIYGRVRAVGGFVSYIVTNYYTNQNYNIHWYIPFSTYLIVITNLGSTGGSGNPTIANWAAQLTSLTNRPGTDNANVTVYSQNLGNPSFGYYTYGIWQVANGTTNQYISTAITILGWSQVGNYNDGTTGTVY